MECEAESQRKLKKIGDFSRPRARASIEGDFFFFCVCVLGVRNFVVSLARARRVKT